MANLPATKTVQVASLPGAAVSRVREEAVANGSLDSDGSAVRFGFMQYYRSLVKQDRESDTLQPVAAQPEAAAPA